MGQGDRGAAASDRGERRVPGSPGGDPEAASWPREVVHELLPCQVGVFPGPSVPRPRLP